MPSITTIDERLTKIADDLEKAINDIDDTNTSAFNILRGEARQTIRELRLEAIAQRQRRET